MHSGPVKLAHPRTGVMFDSPVPAGSGWPGDPATSRTAVAETSVDVASMATAVSSVEELDAEVSVCRACPRLVEWREEVAVNKRKSFADQPYWGRPIPGWGSARPRILIATMDHYFFNAAWHRPELEYLKAVNRAGPPRDPQLLFLLMGQYANANLHGEGVEFLSARLK